MVEERVFVVRQARFGFHATLDEIEDDPRETALCLSTKVINVDGVVYAQRFDTLTWLLMEAGRARSGGRTEKHATRCLSPL
jgi:hypothetical protein